MQITQLIRLDLRAPINYIKTGKKKPDLHSIAPENGEFFLCYNINPLQSRKIEPEREHLLGSLLFYGEKSKKKINGQEVSLPQGAYLFMQQRSDQPLSQDQWLDMAIEQQKDGLWERNKLKDLLYVRYLYEDGAFVTQVFRPIDC